MYGKEFIYSEEGWKEVALLSAEEVQRLHKKLYEVRPVEQVNIQDSDSDKYIIIDRAGWTNNGTLWGNKGDKLLKSGVTLSSFPDEEGFYTIETYNPSQNIPHQIINNNE